MRTQIFHSSIVSHLLITFVLCTFLGNATGCKKETNSNSLELEEPKDSSSLKSTKKKPDYFYAPNFVSIKGNPPFDTITFKDVGIEQLTEKDRPLFFDHLADFIAEDLEDKSDTLKIQEVTAGTNPEFGDPSYHLACGVRHIYVDLWRNTNQTGFSMWSGCGEEDNFAWVEYRNPTNQPVRHLALEISHALSKAIQANCFQKSCLHHSK